MITELPRDTETTIDAWRGVLGDSPMLERSVRVLRQVCARTFQGAAPTVLLGGETGTGKGLVARCLHAAGARAARPLVEVNCAALPPTLMEAELFGHERGSFTDARAARPGLFEVAEGGVLFLDEIGALPLDLQAKLLTAIDEKRVRRIGAARTQPVDVQIVAATHEDLARRVDQGTFRRDLFHRLDVVAVVLPPLRERGADAAVLAQRFLDELCARYGLAPRRLSEAARRWLPAQPWPGNVRELLHRVERIVLLEDDAEVRPEHFAAAGQGRPTEGVIASGELQVTLPAAGVSLDEVERLVMSEALRRCGGNVSRAARFLSITRQTLMYRMKKHRLGERVVRGDGHAPGFAQPQPQTFENAS